MRITELKQQLLALAEKRRLKQDESREYVMPGNDIDEDDGDRKSREQRLRDKLQAKYAENRQAGQPQMTEEERFWQMKEQ